MGSNIEGNSPSGFKFAVGAIPILPLSAAAKSLRISAWRLVATTTSIDLGSRTMRVVIASTNILSIIKSRYSLRSWSKISSHITMPCLCALDLVTKVNFFCGLERAKSRANLCIRSTPERVKTETSRPTSLGCPECTRPPAPAYSPSVFSRTITQSMIPAATSRKGLSIPGSKTEGRTFAY